MNPLFARIERWLIADSDRLHLLRTLADLHLPDAWLAAGLVRNLVWGRLHDYAESTPLADLDVIYFDAADCRPERDREIEALLAAQAPGWPWSVKNQARMHLRNGDRPYRDCRDALAHWPEVETALAARLTAEGKLESSAPSPRKGSSPSISRPIPGGPGPRSFASGSRPRIGSGAGHDCGFRRLDGACVGLARQRLPIALRQGCQPRCLVRL